ncbi:MULTISPECIES: chorismate synthase [unclassified Pseudodesulfovibrio]|uniref:chorismate synthase n=1 Tax=unclassified Pseudodesulfovibrio TaxID=2661612 RepID=UPI000FEB8966|nr:MULTISPECIES: chorismate synthase [unclassified Pseudodesulfovibrio]MCJ2164200.1 chorismate synthase [Pseudodesulfovibrio sp. S3-i]RWU05176.1 chorismate synthase [Pseudodesulfovibrio sp. S3]
MSGNTFGDIFRLTTFGESHGPGLGGVVDGCPAGIPLDESILQLELDKRKPGQGGLASTTRKEPDQVKILSGVFEGKTTGTSIGFYVENTNQRSHDYSKIKDVFRPGHADFTYNAKYGFRDYRGGGRSSGRETVSRVAGGAIAQELLRTEGICVYAYTVEFGGIPAEIKDYAGAQDRPYFSPDPDIIETWNDRVIEVRDDEDTLGGVVEIRVTGLPAGLGEPVFGKLDGRIAQALMSVGAVKGVEIGSGMQAARSLGSLNNDPIGPDGFLSNNAGGILGGISSGQDVIARAYVKPIPSILQEQQTITTTGEPAFIMVGGRHDISAIPRINPVLKAMMALTVADMLLLDRRLGLRD